MRWNFGKRASAPEPAPEPALEPAPEPARTSKFAIENFEMQAIISVSVMTFSMGMLATGRGEPAAYLPVITSVMAYWLPNPTRK